MKPLAYREAVEALDFPAVARTLAPDVTFFSPATAHPCRGRHRVAAALYALSDIRQDLRYTRELTDEGEAGALSQVLLFEARVAGRSLQGFDLLTYGTSGLVTDLTVMVRPLPAAPRPPGSDWPPAGTSPGTRHGAGMPGSGTGIRRCPGP
ncbi:nuclear transport factor 2 family protein [Streptomyces sp. NPDC055078]